jgi:hypothetical protein
MSTRLNISYSSLVRSAQYNNVTIPAGDHGDQLIANLIFAAIAAELRTVHAAKRYVAQAHDIVQKLAAQSLTYRPARPTKLARLVCDVEGTSQTLLLPIINETLVQPAFNAAELPGPGGSVPVNLRQVEIARFLLRLRTRRLEAALRHMGELTSGEELGVSAEAILRECLYNELKTVQPLGRANDLFMLARNLVGRENVAVAKLALKNAGLELEAYMRTTALKEHSAVVQKMKEQIAAIVTELSLERE